MLNPFYVKKLLIEGFSDQAYSRDFPILLGH